MSNVMKSSIHENNPLPFPVAANVVIEQGDLVCVAANSAVASTAVAWNTNIAATQEDVHDALFGVSLDAHSATAKAGNITVATTGIHTFTCSDEVAKAAGTFYGVAKASGNATLQTVVSVATANLEVGTLVYPKAANATSVKLQMRGTIPTGGPISPA